MIDYLKTMREIPEKCNCEKLKTEFTKYKADSLKQCMSWACIISDLRDDNAALIKRIKEFEDKEASRAKECRRYLDDCFEGGKG